MNTNEHTAISYTIKLVDDQFRSTGHFECKNALSWYDAEEEGIAYLKDHPSTFDFMIIETPKEMLQ